MWLNTKHTRTMRNHAFLPHIINPPLLNQAQHRMERASHLKRANLLEILRLEKQPDLRLRRLSSLPLRALQRFAALWCRSEVGQRGIREDWGSVDVGFDEVVRCDDGVARQWQAYGRHIVRDEAPSGRRGIVVVRNAMVGGGVVFMSLRRRRAEVVAGWLRRKSCRSRVF
jgi:hypothetical protein